MLTMVHSFVDRQHEIQQLRRLFEMRAAQLVVVHGRRRIGKTSLLTHWSEVQRGGPHL
jgi:AAA+ ATPase superfamily predicted ATPase